MTIYFNPTFTLDNVNLLPEFRIPSNSFTAEFGKVIMNGVDVTPYTGPMTVTPSRFSQTLLTNERYLTGNITVNPIPSNYGLITWDGSTLTVS